MADLDAELLALAGGDESSGEESFSPPRQQSSSPAPSPQQNRDTTPIDMGRSGTAHLTNRGKGSTVRSSNNSKGRRRLSDAESEGSQEQDDDGPLFPYEQIYYNANDKAEIDALPELKREGILAERALELENRRQAQDLRKMFDKIKTKDKASEQNKRKASAADLEDNQRKSSRQRTKLGGGRAGERDSAIEAYRRSREEKSQRDEQRRRDAAARKERDGKGSPENEYSDADADGESEIEWDNNKYERHSPAPPKDDPPAELVDIQRAKIGRENFAQVCYHPGFQSAIKDCYARVCIDADPVTKANIYRICSIKGFTEGRPYAMTAANGRSFPVDTYILGSHGKATRPFPFVECSMSPITENEWRRYRITMANEDCKIPTKGFINTKLDQIHALLKHHFTDAEITEKVKKQEKLMDKINRVDERELIKVKIDAAQLAGDDAEVRTLEDQLATIMPMKMAFNTSLGKINSHVNKEQERLAELNRRNQKLNAENVRKAQLAEMRAKKSRKHLAPGVDDLFEGGSDISRSGTPVNGVGTPKNNGTPRSSTPINLLKPIVKTKAGIPTIRKAALDDEILASMDLGIDIDI